MNLHELLELKGSEWVDRNLKAKRSPADPDREALIEYLCDDLSPVLAARKVDSTGKSNRASDGLVWLAYDVENQLYESMGEGIDVLLERLKKDQEVEINSSRARRLEFAAGGAGLETKRVIMLRIR